MQVNTPTECFEHRILETNLTLRCYVTEMFLFNNILGTTSSEANCLSGSLDFFTSETKHNPQPVTQEFIPTKGAVDASVSKSSS